MCTAVTLKAKDGSVAFGRTLDFHLAIEPHLYAYAHSAQLESAGIVHEGRYAAVGIGMGSSARKAGLFDGVNERGLAGAVLYFPGYAHFPETVAEGADPQRAVASLDVLRLLLSSCATLDDVRAELAGRTIVAVTNSVTGGSAPMHWIFTDSSGAALTVEQTADGLNVYDNPVGVMTNSPELPWHLTNLRTYCETRPAQKSETDWGSLRLTPFGQGCGTSGLPAGFQPPARFVRTVFEKYATPQPSDADEAINTVLHILEGVTIPKDVVVTADGKSDYTTYTAFVDVTGRAYYFKTYENPQVVRVPWEQAVEGLASGDERDLGSIRVPVSYLTLA